MAKPGYGKRSVPGQSPSRPGDFTHLPPREAYLASLLDRLCDNAAMDAKTIAKAQPLYGQQAVRSALNALGRAGHLRRVRCRVEPTDGVTHGTRWVFRTFWSRIARQDDWWARFLDGDAADAGADLTAAPAAELTDTAVESPAPAAVVPSPRPHVSTPSTAHLTLARLGLSDPRLALSSDDCAALEPLAADWLARDVSPDQLLRILVAGLPEQVHSPRAFVRRRLVDKMPPVPEIPAVQPRRLLMECTDCGVPGRPEALPGGLCRACRDTNAAAGAGTGLRKEPTRMDPAAVHARTAHLRTSIRSPRLVTPPASPPRTAFR